MSKISEQPEGWLKMYLSKILSATEAQDNSYLLDAHGLLHTGGHKALELSSRYTK